MTVLGQIDCCMLQWSSATMILYLDVEETYVCLRLCGTGSPCSIFNWEAFCLKVSFDSSLLAQLQKMTLFSLQDVTRCIKEGFSVSLKSLHGIWSYYSRNEKFSVGVMDLWHTLTQSSLTADSLPPARDIKCKKILNVHNRALDYISIYFIPQFTHLCVETC